MSDRFTKQPTLLAGVYVVSRSPLHDTRGYLERLYCTLDLGDVCDTDQPLVQINHTLTRTPGTVRGMHYQLPPHADRKIVSCLRGEVFDVVIDLRPHSPTYLGWHAEVLSDDNHRSLIVPEGCAHGFQTLTEDCELLYFHTGYWHPQSEAGVHPLDPLIGITWPKPIADMSARDRSHPPLTATLAPHSRKTVT